MNPLPTFKPALRLNDEVRLKQITSCLILFLAGCSQTLAERRNSNPPFQTLIGQVTGTESITLVATNGSLHPAEVITFSAADGTTAEFISIFACPLKDSRYYSVLLEASPYHFIGKRKADDMPDQLVRYCAPVDEGNSFGRM